MEIKRPKYWASMKKAKKSASAIIKGYRLTLTDGTVEMIDNPSSYPDPSNIVKQEEPFVDVHLYTPNDYVGCLLYTSQVRTGCCFANAAFLVGDGDDLCVHDLSLIHILMNSMRVEKFCSSTGAS